MCEKKLKSYYQTGVVEAGVDEAGRGCLAGPVFAAAVILPSDFQHPLINDSKKLSEKLRYQLRTEIEKQAVSFAVEWVDEATIDKINILNASILAMHKAINKLHVKPSSLLIDGNRFKKMAIPHNCFVKGDAMYFSIAAASILAKTYRDDLMLKLHSEFPQYKWNSNKGYGTKEHCDAIFKFGLTKYHRKSFHLKQSQLKLEFPEE
jgi:ribonuclease HII